jgi:hypothetical protein
MRFDFPMRYTDASAVSQRQGIIVEVWEYQVLALKIRLDAEMDSL